MPPHPDGDSPGGISDSIVSGDVHHHHYQQQTQQPPQVFTGQPQAPQPVVVMGDMPGMGVPATSATTALVLSIVSIFCGGLCLAIPSLIIANQALAITDQYPGHPDAGNAKAARIVSWIVIGLTIVGLFIYLVLGIAMLESEY